MKSLSLSNPDESPSNDVDENENNEFSAELVTGMSATTARDPKFHVYNNSLTPGAAV